MESRPYNVFFENAVVIIFRGSRIYEKNSTKKCMKSEYFACYDLNDPNILPTSNIFHFRTINEFHFIFNFYSYFIFQSTGGTSPRSDSSANSVSQDDAGAPVPAEKVNMAAAVYSREPSFDDNRSDLFDDDEDSRGFLRHNESDEGLCIFFVVKWKGWCGFCCEIVAYSKS